jgi:IS30 family transposase
MKLIQTKGVQGVADAIIDALKPFDLMGRTITLGNRLEFARHERIVTELNIKG